MKTLFSVLALGFVIITTCMVYLIKSGTSIRSELLIRPSIMTQDLSAISRAMVVRLTPEFQNSSYVVIDFDSTSATANEVLTQLQSEFERLLGKQVTRLGKAESRTTEEVHNCPKPCWLLVESQPAHQLSANAFIEKKLKPLSESFITLTWIPFQRDLDVSQACVDEKRLTFDCLVPLSVHEARRKMREPDKRYFFMKKHLTKDFFLFTEQR